MTKIKNWFISHLSFVLYFIACVCFCVAIIIALDYFIGINADSTYVISPDTCVTLFGSDPESYMRVWDDEGASIDEDGNLVLVYTPEEREQWVTNSKMPINMMIWEGKVNDVSSDYKKVSVMHDMLISYDLDMLDLLCSCVNMQFLNGCDPDELEVTLEVIDPKSNAVIVSAVWPKETIEYSYSDEDGVTTVRIENYSIYQNTD